MTYTVPKAAVRVMRDALAEAETAGITDPDAITQHQAAALAAHGWYVTGHPATRRPHAPPPGEPMTEMEHVREYPSAEDETPRCAEDCPACLAHARSDDDRNMPCGESGCYCRGESEEHADCACGCDCPRYTNEIGEYVIVGDE